MNEERENGSRASACSLRDFADDDGKTLGWWIEEMKRIHPRIGWDFEIGVVMFEKGDKRPYDNYWGKMNEGQKLLRLGWDMARRSKRLLSKANTNDMPQSSA